MKERLIIILVAIIAGLFITSAGFFIYQSTKKGVDTPITQKQPGPTSQPVDTGLFVNISEPKDESLTNKRTLLLKGTTNPENIIVVSSNLEDVEVIPTTEGTFSISVDIDAGANEITTRAIAPDGSSVQDLRTITYSTEEF